MECLDEPTVLALVAGEIIGGERRRLERHLDGCTACVELVTQTRLALGSEPATHSGVAPGLGAPDAIDRYVLGPEIARGGMGRLVAAYDRRLDREIAIKIALDRSDATKRRFTREVALTSRLEHPAIVPMHDAGTLDDGTPFYAMRLVGGETLDRVVARSTTASARMALLPNVLAVADAMAYVHARGVIHRDLKPQNILLGEFGETVLLDWGLAKDLAEEPAREEIGVTSEVSPATDATTHHGAALGTPAYMAPEQAIGADVDRRADVYGLGATLRHVLAGAPPPRDRPAPIAAIEGVPRELGAIVARAMATEPGERYPSARELASDVRRFLTGQLVLAHRYSLGQRFWRWVGRNRAAVLIGAAALTAIATLSIVGVLRIVDERREAESARAIAETQRDAGQSLVSFMLGDLHDRLDRLGRLDLLADTSSQVIAYYDKLRTTSSVTARQELDALTTRGEATLAAGDGAAALVAFEQALTGADRLVADERELAACDLHLHIGDARRALGQIAASKGAYQACVTVASQRVHEHPDATAWRLSAVKAIVAVSEVLLLDGDNAGARRHCSEALELVQPLLTSGGDPDDKAHVAALKASLDLAQWSIEALDWSSASAAADRTLAMARTLAVRRPDDLIVFNAMTAGWNVVGRLREHAGDLVGAETAFRAAYTAAQTLVAREPREISFRRNLGVELESLGRIAKARGDMVGATKLLESSRDLSAELVAIAPDNIDLLEELALSEVAFADAIRARDHVGARQAYQRSIATSGKALALAPGEMRLESELGIAYGHLAELEDMAGDGSAARTAIDHSLALARAVQAAAPASASQLTIATVLYFRAKFEPERAAADLTEAVELVAPMRNQAAGDAYLTAFLPELDAAARKAGVRLPAPR